MLNDSTYEQFLEKIKSTNPKQYDKCFVRNALELFSGKWKTRVLFELCKQESIRFGELRKSIPPITNTMLASTLKELEQKGLVSRTQFDEIPPHVEYSLTESGLALLPIFFQIAKWGETYLLSEVEE